MKFGKSTTFQSLRRKEFSDIRIDVDAYILSVESLARLPVVLVFCSDPPLSDLSTSSTSLYNKLVKQPYPKSGQQQLLQFSTLYRGACLQYQMDVVEPEGGTYLYYDTGKK